MSPEKSPPARKGKAIKEIPEFVAPARLDLQNVARFSNDRFAEQETHRHLIVIARRAHGNADRPAADADFQRLFDDQIIAVAPRYAVGKADDFSAVE